MKMVLVRPGACLAQGFAIPFFTPLAGARCLKRSVGPEAQYSFRFGDGRCAG